MPRFNVHDSQGRKNNSQRESRRRVPTSDQTKSNDASTSFTRSPNVQFQIGSDFSEATFERHAALLGDRRMSHSMYARQRVMIVQQLQRDYGLRYVQRLVKHISQKRAEATQTKLAVGPAGDKFEQEADRVAKQVVGITEPPAQRQEELAEEEMVQAKPDGSAQRQEGLAEEELQMKAGPGLLQRQGTEEEELLQSKITPVPQPQAISQRHRIEGQAHEDPEHTDGYGKLADACDHWLEIYANTNKRGVDEGTEQEQAYLREHWETAFINLRGEFQGVGLDPAKGALELKKTVFPGVTETNLSENITFINDMKTFGLSGDFDPRNTIIKVKKFRRMYRKLASGEMEDIEKQGA